MVKVDGSINTGNYISLLRSNPLSDSGDGVFLQHDFAPLPQIRCNEKFLVDEDVELWKDCPA